MKDKKIQEAIEKERERQLYNIELIASENYVSKDVLEAAGSILTNKYAEGYPSKRYYGGCIHVDEVEELARKRAMELFHAEHANVQPHSGSQANMGVYMAVLEPGDTVLGMNLTAGGHLTHGHPAAAADDRIKAVFQTHDEVIAAAVTCRLLHLCIRCFGKTSTGIYEMAHILYGGVFVKETKAPEAFLLDENAYYVEISEHGKIYEVENEAGKGFVNAAQTGSLRIEKTSSDGKVEGFSFRVTGANG